MSELISGKEALIALANGESVQKRSDSWAGDHWLDISKKEPFNLDCFLSGLNRHGETIKFRIKPRTITINGIEVHAPFFHRPEVGQIILYLDDSEPQGFTGEKFVGLRDADFNYGWWDSVEKIKVVVAALRKAFGGVYERSN